MARHSVRPAGPRRARGTPFLSVPSWVLGAALLLPLLAGCGGDRLPGTTELAAFESGAPKSDVLNALPGGAYTESTERRVLHGYPTQRYLVEGRLVEVVWVTPAGETRMEAPPRESRNPVIFVDNHLDGWGWSHFDQRKEDFGIPEPAGPGAPSPPPAEGGEEGPGVEGPEGAGDGSGDHPDEGGVPTPGTSQVEAPEG